MRSHFLHLSPPHFFYLVQCPPHIHCPSQFVHIRVVLVPESLKVPRHICVIVQSCINIAQKRNSLVIDTFVLTGACVRYLEDYHHHHHHNHHQHHHHYHNHYQHHHHHQHHHYYHHKHYHLFITVSSSLYRVCPNEMICSTLGKGLDITINTITNINHQHHQHHHNQHHHHAYPNCSTLGRARNRKPVLGAFCSLQYRPCMIRT